jgi:hypothetical protein
MIDQTSLVGMVLQSGALCIAERVITADGEAVVLAFRTHPLHPYVVWTADRAGNCWRGDYCSSLTEAAAAFEARSGHRP